MVAYIQASTNSAMTSVFISHVRALEALLKPDWHKTWPEEKKKIIQDYRKNNPQNIKDKPAQFKIEAYYQIFLKLMDIIKKADRLY